MGSSCGTIGPTDGHPPRASSPRPEYSTKHRGNDRNTPDDIPSSEKHALRTADDQPKSPPAAASAFKAPPSNAAASSEEQEVDSSASSVRQPGIPELLSSPQNCETGEMDDASRVPQQAVPVILDEKESSPSYARDESEAEGRQNISAGDRDGIGTVEGIPVSGDGISGTGSALNESVESFPGVTTCNPAIDDVDHDSGVEGEEENCVGSVYNAQGEDEEDYEEESLMRTTSSGASDGKMAGIGQLAITKPAPDFEATAVINGEFKQVKLSDYRGNYVVLFFYPLDFTFVCPTEIIAFSDRVEEFRAIKCEVMACSTDSQYSHLAWVDTPRRQGGLGPMKIPLLADKTMEISKKYGCLKEDEGVAFRGLYIIDDKGNLRQITINDLPVGRSVDETLRLVQAFQFTDEHGEVCPAGWKPGKETMKPNPKESQNYFNKVN